MGPAEPHYLQLPALVGGGPWEPCTRCGMSRRQPGRHDQFRREPRRFDFHRRKPGRRDQFRREPRCFDRGEAHAFLGATGHLVRTWAGGPGLRRPSQASMFRSLGDVRIPRGDRPLRANLGRRPRAPSTGRPLGANLYGRPPGANLRDYSRNRSRSSGVGIIQVSSFPKSRYRRLAT